MYTSILKTTIASEIKSVSEDFNASLNDVKEQILFESLNSENSSDKEIVSEEGCARP